MIAARSRALLLPALLLAAFALLVVAGVQRSTRATLNIVATPRPTLLLVTSLPLLFHDDFSIRSVGSPALSALQSHYRVLPISVTDQRALAKGQLLLMAQPQAQTAENLVALDTWVRKGGRLVLLADPLLEWPSGLPLGDVTRPLAVFMDTGLLVHWGIEIDAPREQGRAERELGGYTITTSSPGRLSGNCTISTDRLVAHCGIGAGKVTIIADADFLNVNAFGSNGRHNIDGLLEELASIRRS